MISTYQLQEEHGTLPQETPFCVVALWRCYIMLTQTQEEHGVPPNKHYEIPFVRGYAVLFPPSKRRSFA